MANPFLPSKDDLIYGQDPLNPTPVAPTVGTPSPMPQAQPPAPAAGTPAPAPTPTPLNPTPAAAPGQAPTGAPTTWDNIFQMLPSRGIFGIAKGIHQQGVIQDYTKELQAAQAQGMTFPQAFAKVIPNYLHRLPADVISNTISMINMNKPINTKVGDHDLMRDPFSGKVVSDLSEPKINKLAMPGGGDRLVQSNTTLGTPDNPGRVIVTDLGAHGPQVEYKVIEGMLVGINHETGQVQKLLNLAGNIANSSMTEQQKNIASLVRLGLDPGVAVDMVYKTIHVQADPVNGGFAMINDRTGKSVDATPEEVNGFQNLQQQIQQLGGQGGNAQPGSAPAGAPGKAGSGAGGPPSGALPANAQGQTYELGKMPLEDAAKYGTGAASSISRTALGEISQLTGTVMTPQMLAGKDMLEQFNQVAKQVWMNTRYNGEREDLNNLLTEPGFGNSPANMAQHISQLRDTMKTMAENYWAQSNAKGIGRKPAIELKQKASDFVALIKLMGPEPTTAWWASGGTQNPAAGQAQTTLNPMAGSGGKFGSTGGSLQSIPNQPTGTPGSSQDNPVGPMDPKSAAGLPSGTWFTTTDNPPRVLQRQ